MSRWNGRVTPYPPAAVARYRAAGHWGARTIAAEFRAVADRWPGRDAAVGAEGRLTFRELDEQADLVAAGLSGLGLAPGDRVLLQLTNRLLTVVAWYGTLKAGLIPVCTLAAHRAHEIGPISRRTDAVAHLVDGGTRFDLVEFARQQARDHPTLRHVVTVGAGPGAAGTRIEDMVAGGDPAAARELVDRIQAAIDPDEVAVFQLSGGTTGVPKVIPRMHAEYWYNAKAYARALGWDIHTRTGHLIPIVHNAGVVCGLHGPHAVGGCAVLTGPDPDRSLPLLAAEGVTDVLLGHGHFGLVAHPGFPALARPLRRAVLSGAKVPPALFDALERSDIWSGQLFGMGEGFFALTRLDAPRSARLTTVGTPLAPDDEYRLLVPGTEDPVPVGAVGELACRGPYTLRGYYDANEANARSFTTDGFYRTGDLVAERRIDGGTYLSVEGRLKDLINRGGEKISAEEVELLLLQHPGIAAAAVVPMPDDRLGERACAYLVGTGSPLTLPALQQHFAGLGVATYKWPERLEWLGELPRTPVGKIDKKWLHSDIVGKLRAESPAAEPAGTRSRPSADPTSDRQVPQTYPNGSARRR